MRKLSFVITSVCVVAASVASASVFPPISRAHTSTVCAFFPNGDAIECVGRTTATAASHIDIFALHASASRDLPTLAADAH